MTLTFLFWNLCNRADAVHIGRMARQHDVDFLVLAEAGDRLNSILDDLNPPGDSLYALAPNVGCDRIHIVSRFNPDFIEIKSETSRYTIRECRIPLVQPFLLVAVHMQSRLYYRCKSQAGHCQDLADDIKAVEKQVKHKRTLLVGDINQDPFEEGAVSAKALHGMMTRDLAARERRPFNSRNYDLFYNPMWSLLGDECRGPTGTYYYRQNKELIETYWHMFDQVMLRPGLLEGFSADDLQILDSDGEDSLLDPNGVTSDHSPSDHLPILFTMSLEEEEVLA